MSAQTQERILRINKVLQLTGLTRSTLYRKMHQGTFPKQIKLSLRCAGWRESAVNSWLQDPDRYSAPDQGS